MELGHTFASVAVEREGNREELELTLNLRSRNLRSQSPSESQSGKANSDETTEAIFV